MEHRTEDNGKLFKRLSGYEFRANGGVVTGDTMESVLFPCHPLRGIL